MQIAFGPVPSRRLGKSLGINNVRPKVCSYSCIYCQLGKTSECTIERQAFYPLNEIYDEVAKKVHYVSLMNERIDHLTFVSDGEPTLDINLGREISRLKQIGLPVAVITNSSLLWLEDVRQDLLKADYVSLKVDALDEALWRRIDRPHKTLRLDAILNGIQNFTESFKGTVVTETMLVDDVQYANEFERIAAFLATLKKLDRAYIAVPTRPPAENWVKPAKEEVVNAAYQAFSEKLGVDKVEFLIGYEGAAFAFTGNAAEDLLSIMAVHPMRDEAVKEFLWKANAGWQVIERLLAAGKLVELEYEGNLYYMRKLNGRKVTRESAS
ncbi:MAG: radical SAM protein [Candidatus Bathyarchaeota archaeon]|nr:radical SAM protein [Candidatus Bathyarchaeota archaeon]